MTKRLISTSVIAGVLVAGATVVVVHGAHAQTVASDRTAGFVVFPKIVVDPSDIFGQGRSVDTVVQLTNTAPGAGADTGERVVHCFYVDATSHCTNGANDFDPGGACRTTADCRTGGVCAPDWTETDFTIALTPEQPVGWNASTGFLSVGLCSGGSLTGQPCNDDTDCPGGTCSSLPIGRIPPLSPIFVGELKCFEVDGVALSPPGGTTVTPVNRNDLKGEASIYEVEPGVLGTSRVDVREYNGIGIQAVSSNGATQADRTLCLGATTGSTECAAADYAACPATLILNHFFDGATVGTNETVTTDLTLVPCSENFLVQATQVITTAQFLVFNEFEQRFSASTRIDCFKETPLSNIDARAGNESSSIFNVAVQGTLTGQTKIRGVLGPETDTGHGLLGIAEEFVKLGGVDPRSSTAFNLNYAGLNVGKGDFVRFTVP